MVKVDPWRVLGTRVGYDGGWWRLRLDRCETHTRAVIESYPVLEYPDWVNIVALRRDDGRVILTREYRHGVGRVVLALPGGTVEQDEMRDGPKGLERAAKRELLEETGHVSQRFLPVGTFLPNAATHSNRLSSFLALDATCRQSPEIDNESGDEISLEFAELGDLIDDIRTGRVTMESGHVAAIYAAQAHLQTL